MPPDFILPWGVATLLALLIIPPFRLISIKSFRNRVGKPSLVVAGCCLAVGFYLTLLGVAALYAPTLLYLFAICVAIILVVVWWGARPSFGRSRGLPPGSLAFFPTGPWNDRAYYATRLARYGPVFKHRHLYHPEVCIGGVSRVRAFIQANDASIRTPQFPFGRYIPGGFLRFTDPARHTQARPIFQAAFAPAVYQAHADLLDRVLSDELAAMSAASLGAVRGINPAPGIEDLLFRLLAGLFFGIDSRLPQEAHFCTLLRGVALHRTRVLADRDVAARLDELIIELRHRVSANDRTSFAAALERAHPGALNDRFFTFNLIFMFHTARNDLGGLFAWLIKMLADHPQWAAQLRSEPDASNLSGRIVLETLRLEQSEYLLRQTNRDITFEGFTIPKGWFVRLVIKESHHASDAFENPTLFDPDRFLDRHYSRSEYMPFGAFNKTCLGEHLTLNLAKKFVTELARGYMLHVTEDGPQEFSGFHWQPSSHFHVQFAPLAPHPDVPAQENKTFVQSV